MKIFGQHTRFLLQLWGSVTEELKPPAPGGQGGGGEEHNPNHKMQDCADAIVSDEMCKS